MQHQHPIASSQRRVHWAMQYSRRGECASQSIQPEWFQTFLDSQSQNMQPWQRAKASRIEGKDERFGVTGQSRLQSLHSDGNTRFSSNAVKPKAATTNAGVYQSLGVVKPGRRKAL